MSRASRSRVVGSPAEGDGGEEPVGSGSGSRAAARPVRDDMDDDDDEKPVPTPAERGLTIDTFHDRPVVGDKGIIAKLKPLVKGFEGARQKVEDSLTHLQATAVSLSEAGLLEDEELFNSIDASFRSCLDELALIEIRDAQLDKIYKDLLEDGNEITDIQGMNRDGCEKGQDAYKTKSDKSKYAKNAKYHTFRDRVWETRSTGEPMPLLSTLFAKDEAAPGGHADGTDSDSDMELGGVVVSFKCPITLKPMEDPWSSTACPHSFEKSAIFEFIDAHARKEVTCPTSGCVAKINKSKLKENADLKKRIAADTRRAAKAREQREDSAEEIESDDE